MTDEEVAATARGGSKEISRRVARHSPTKPVGRLVSDKPAPPRITVAEMERIQRARGRLSDRVRERVQTDREADVVPTRKRTRKPSPAEEPTGRS